ncbi:MAG: hypothetical protein FWC06_01800 [Treponema sp.]|nr:hypothetical protein [Treponema sp.]
MEAIGWIPIIPEGSLLFDVLKYLLHFLMFIICKGINYNTCDIFFHVSASGLKPEALHPEKSEVADTIFFKPDEIDFSDFAFQSTVKAVKDSLDSH